MIEGAYQRFASRMCSATQVAALIVALLSSPVAGVELGRGDVKRMFEIDRYILSAEAQLAIGEYVSARQSALDAYNLLARSTADKESVLGLRAIGMLGATLVRLNERNKAIQSFKEGAALIPKIVNESEPRTRDWFLTTGFHVMQFYARMAEAQMLAGELLDADRSLADASVLTQSSGISDSFLFLHINRLKAQLALVRNQPEVAQKLFENSLDIVGNFILQMRINPSAASVLAGRSNSIPRRLGGRVGRFREPGRSDPALSDRDQVDRRDESAGCRKRCAQCLVLALRSDL